MKGVLEFALHEEQQGFRMAQDAWKYSETIEDMFKWLRALEKYDNVETLTVQQVRAKLVEIRNGHFDEP